MDVRTLLATLAALGTGAAPLGCGAKPDAKAEAKEVAPAKAAAAKPSADDGKGGTPKAGAKEEGAATRAAPSGDPVPAAADDAHPTDAAGEMACAPGKCGAEMMKKQPAPEGEGDGEGKSKS